MKKALITLFAFACLFCKAQIEEDSVDRYGPFLVKVSGLDGSTYISGVSTLKRALTARDTLRYWITVVDTAHAVTLYDSAIGVRFHLALQMRGYGLWMPNDPDFGPHWEIYDERFRKMRDLPLYVIRIIEIPIEKLTRRKDDYDSD